jgi:hypothetical protein
MQKESFIVNCNTLPYVSTLLGHLQGELFVIFTLRLHFIVECKCAVDGVLCTGGVNSLRSGLALQARTAESSRLQKQRSTQSTAHSHSTVKCKPSVTVKESPPWRWPSRVKTCRSVLPLMMKLSLCICWWLVLVAWSRGAYGNSYYTYPNTSHSKPERLPRPIFFSWRCFSFHKLTFIVMNFRRFLNRILYPLKPIASLRKAKLIKTETAGWVSAVKCWKPRRRELRYNWHVCSIYVVVWLYYIVSYYWWCWVARSASVGCVSY